MKSKTYFSNLFNLILYFNILGIIVSADNGNQTESNEVLIPEEKLSKEVTPPPEPTVPNESLKLLFATKSEPQFPDENILLSRTTTLFGKEPQIPEEKIFTRKSLVTYEPHIPDENKIFSKKSLFTNEPEIPDENKIFSRSWFYTKEPDLPNERTKYNYDNTQQIAVTVISSNVSNIENLNSTTATESKKITDSSETALQSTLTSNSTFQSTTDNNKSNITESLETEPQTQTTEYEPTTAFESVIRTTQPEEPKLQTEETEPTTSSLDTEIHTDESKPSTKTHTEITTKTRLTTITRTTPTKRVTNTTQPKTQSNTDVTTTVTNFVTSESTTLTTNLTEPQTYQTMKDTTILRVNLDTQTVAETKLTKTTTLQSTVAIHSTPSATQTVSKTLSTNLTEQTTQSTKTDTKSSVPQTTQTSITYTNVTTTESAIIATVISETDEICIKSLCPYGSYCNPYSTYGQKCVCDRSKGFQKNDKESENGLKCDFVTACNKYFTNRCGKAKCIEIGTNIDNGFECVCDIGYSIDKANTEDNSKWFCKPNKCEFPLLSKCSQNCENNNDILDINSSNLREFTCKCYDGYKPNNSNITSCVPDINSTSHTICQNKNCFQNSYCVNGECICKRGYTLSNDKCIIDKDWCSRNCPDNCVEDKLSKTIICNCSSPKYEINQNTGLCNLIDHCSEDKRLECDKQNAVCIQSSEYKQNSGNNTRGYECECADGSEFIGGKCVNVCDNQWNIAICNALNSVCMPQISQKNIYRCDCKPGFIRYSEDYTEACVMSAITSVIKLKIRNPQINYMRSDSSYYDLWQTQVSNEERVILRKNMLSLFERSKQNRLKSILSDIVFELRKSLKYVLMKQNILSYVSLINCLQSSQDNNDYECEFTVQYNHSNGYVELRKLIQSCNNSITNDNNKQYCYLLPNTVIGRQNPTIDSYDPCSSSNACSMSIYSKCLQISGTSLFECLCPKEKYYVTETRFIGQSLNGRDLRLEYCADIDECAAGKCNGLNQTCINSIGTYYCLCNDGYKNGTNKDECVPLCNDVNCGHGVCKTGKVSYLCECETAYTGVKCDSKIIESLPIYYIITIGCLGLILILLTLVVAFYFGKLRNRKTEQRIIMNDLSHFKRISSHPSRKVNTLYKK